MPANLILAEQIAHILRTEIPLEAGEAARLVAEAADQLAVALPVIQSSAGALGETDQGRSLRVVAYMLAGLQAKLAGA